jgi:succinoglycan biosynthesis protein ExoM
MSQTSISSVVSICIATYQRPDGLRRLLGSFADLEVPSGYSLEVVVVDNDPQAASDSTSAEIVAEFSERTGVPVIRVLQSEPNISVTRNVSVDEASGQLIWFLDDDQTVSADCLVYLLETLEQADADGVSGSVVPCFEGEPPDWIRHSSTFNRARETRGAPTRAFGIANTMIKASALALVAGPFDIRFGATGGEDSMLFRQLIERGIIVVAAPDAVVHEFVPLARSNMEWMTSRRRRQGQNYLRQVVILSGGRFRAGPVRALVGAVAWMAILGCKLGVSRAGTSARAETTQRLHANIGKIQGWKGASTQWVDNGQ